jgi:hypothetical protein
MERIGQALTRVAEKRGPAPRSDTPAKLPPAFDPTTDRLSRLICWTSNDGRSELVRELTADERSALKARVAGLEESLQAFGEAGVHKVNAALSAMFSGFRSMRQADQSIDDTLVVTRAVLRDLPA